MKPPAFVYHDPATVDEALDLLARLEGALPLAGGQSLMPMLNFRVVSPGHIVDLGRIEALSIIHVDEAGGRFGAMTTQRALEFSPDVARAFPVLREALGHVGHRQTRNRGTFGGSLCHLDPSAELANIVALHDGILHVAGKGGERRIRMDHWVKDYMTNSLEAGELLVGIEMKAWPHGHGFAFEEFARRHGNFAIVAAACLVSLDSTGAFERVALAISGLSAAPARLSEAEQMILGERPSINVYHAVARAAAALPATEDAFATSAYRSHLAAVLARRSLERASKRARPAHG